MLKKILLLALLLTLSKLSLCQIYLIEGDSLHCFTRHQAVGIAQVITELQSCRELELLNEQGLEQWGIMVDAKDAEIINLEQQIRVQFEIGEYYKNQHTQLQKMYKKEVRKHNFTKVAGVLLLTVGVGLMVLQ